MQQWKKIFKENLDNLQSLAILGIGSELRADDYAGMYVGFKLQKYFLKNKISFPEIKIFLGATAPENFTGEIIKFAPSHLIIIDSADFKKEPGTICLLNPDEINGISFCTHLLPIKILIDYLLKNKKIEIIIIGIQPQTLKFGEVLSEPVKKSADLLIKTIKKIICV